MKPLSGRLILDCSTLLPGPLVGKLMANQGARVVKIENPKRPDGAKAMGAFYRDLNDCKEIVELELGSSRDSEKFAQWARQADGLIEGYRPATKLRLGLTADQLHRINPKLCIASIVGYPEDGPWRDRAGHNLNFEAVTGCLSLFNEMPPLPLADLFGAYSCALSLTAALDSVARGGPGRRISTSLSQALVDAQSSLIRQFQETGREPTHGTTLFSGAFPCYRFYTASDGKKVSVGAIEHKFWETFCQLTDLTHLIPRGYGSDDDAKEVAEAVQNRIGSRPSEHWEQVFKEADCCVDIERSYSELYGV